MLFFKRFHAYFFFVVFLFAVLRAVGFLAAFLAVFFFAGFFAAVLRLVAVFLVAAFFTVRFFAAGFLLAVVFFFVAFLTAMIRGGKKGNESGYYCKSCRANVNIFYTAKK